MAHFSFYLVSGLFVYTAWGKSQGQNADICKFIHHNAALRSLARRGLAFCHVGPHSWPVSYWSSHYAEREESRFIMAPYFFRLVYLFCKDIYYLSSCRPRLGPLPVINVGWGLGILCWTFYFPIVIRFLLSRFFCWAIDFYPGYRTD